MKKQQLVFIQGGGDGGYEADKALVGSLRENLSEAYAIYYPEMQSEKTAPDFGWVQQIEKNISEAEDHVILGGHSLGASMLLKCLSETTINKKINGIFLMLLCSGPLMKRGKPV